MDTRKEKTYFPFVLLLLIIVSFWDVFFMRATLYRGDYVQQFYPWLSFYSENIKNLQLPLWTRHVQSGFPIFAEGQTGMLYPLNLVFFFILPFRIAYNYSFLFHYFLAGLFMYLYCRKIKMDIWGSSIAAGLLCLSTVYAGSFINVPTLKALCFFPLILLLFELCLGTRKKPLMYFLLIGLVWGAQLMAGSFQMSIYNIGFCLAYFLCRNVIANRKILPLVLYSGISLCAAVLLSLPQLAFTSEIAQYSSRASQTLGFALWNSFNPAAFTGLLLPIFGSIFIRTNVIYLGAVSIFLVFISLSHLKEDRSMWPVLLLLFLGVFIALGKFNPLYAEILNVFKFYSFRGPAKIIYFIAFALSVLAGKGFDLLFAETDRDKLMIAAKAFGVTALFTSGMFFISKLILRFFSAPIMSWSKSYVKENIYGRSFHRYDLDFYLSKLEDFIGQLSLKLSFSNPYILFGILMLCLSAIFVFIVIRIRRKAIMRWILAGIIFIDLFIMSFYFEGPRSGMVEFKEIKVSHPAIYNVVKDDDELFRIYPYGAKETLPEWAYFSSNMLYGIDSIGLYTPLMNRDYYQKLKGLGVVDDSLGVTFPKKEVIDQEKLLIQNLNVKYIVSSEQLEGDFFEEIAKENDIHLYKLTEYRPRFWISNSDTTGNPIVSDVDIVEYTSGKAEVRVDSDIEGYLIFSEKYYPGWKAFVDGEKTEVLSFMDILQAVKIPAGEHTVRFVFRPDMINEFFIIQLGVFVFILLYCGYAMLVSKMSSD